MSNQGCKDGYKTKILAYLKENTNSKNKASILKSEMQYIKKKMGMIL